MKEENLINMERCHKFQGCSQNLCPLVIKLNKRVGEERDKCRWMRNPKQKKIQGRVFTSGGTVMPDALLKYVPERNVKYLNENSRNPIN